MVLPVEITESELDDTQSVDFNLNTLVQRFINPIENKRSFVTINPTSRPRSKSIETETLARAISRDLDSAEPNREAQESRAHAFYRMIGLPVMDADYNFYNPGFNPLRSTRARERQTAIADSPLTNVDKLHAARETAARNSLNIFRTSPLKSSILSLAMKKVKNFQVIDTAKAFDENDPQKFTVKERRTFLEKFYQTSDGKELPTFFEQGVHILRPFLVSPVIERTVQSRNRQICEPFLPDRNATRLEGNTFLERPGIEFILRLRLRQNKVNETLEETIFILDSKLETEGVSAADLRQIAVALFDKENISTENASVETANISNLELLNINKLIKLIKAAVDGLANSVERIDSISKEINWTPLPGENGPQEAGKTELAGFVRTKRAGSNIERQIKQLEIKASNSRRRGTISDDEEIANSRFAIQYFENTEQLFTNELEDVKAEKNTLIGSAANDLAMIEIVTGEISGLGLVDILAIYTALWAIDLDVLVSLLDNEAFQRLVDNNPDLINPNVQTRKDAGKPVFNGFDAIQKFEAQIINILAWADKLLQQRQATPDVAEGGAVPQGG